MTACCQNEFDLILSDERQSSGVGVPGGEDFVHGGAATPALQAEPLPWLRRSRLSLKDLKGKTKETLFISD